MKIKLIVITLLLLSGCSGKNLKYADDKYQVNYGGYAALKSDCFDKNKHSASFTPEGASEPVVLTFAASGCEQIGLPQHGGKYIADIKKAYIGAGGQVAGVLVQGALNYAIAENNNDTRVDLSEIQSQTQVDLSQLQNERQDNSNQILIQALNSSQAQAEAVIDSSAEISDTLFGIIENLTQPEEVISDF